MREILKKLYYDPATGYQSINRFYKRAKKEIPSLTIKDVQTFLEQQETQQINKETRKPKHFTNIKAYKPRYSYQMDLMIYDRYESNRYKYILVVIDVHSRYVTAKALTSRENLLTHIKEIFDEMGKPENVNCDLEFNTREINKYFEENKIIPWFSEPDEINKNAIVERYNRTLAGILQKWRVATGKTQWYKVLPQIIDNLNGAYHRTIKAIPADVWEGKDDNKQIQVTIPVTFEKGDLVRIKQKKKLLGKGDYIKFSEETYKISSIKGQKITLEDVETGAKLNKKPYELKKVSEFVTYENTESEIRVPVSKQLDEAKKKKKLERELRNIDNAVFPEEGRRKRVRLSRCFLHSSCFSRRDLKMETLQMVHVTFSAGL